MDNPTTIEELALKLADLEIQITAREQEILSLRTEVSELREATSTLSIWMEKLAESGGAYLKPPQ